MGSVPERMRISADRYLKMVETGVLGKYSVRQPDLLLKPREDFYSGQIPSASDVLLLVEVSDSSLGFDLGGKRALYARQRILEYWVVNIPGKCLHVYRDPWGDRYTQAMECTPADTVSPRELPVIQVAVGTLFA